MCIRDSISVEELAEHLKKPHNTTLIDIRTREEHEAIKLPHTVILTQELQTELFTQKSAEDLIILIDHQGHTVLDQCAWFRGHGLKKTYGVDGGIDRYAEKIDTSIQRYRLELD